MTFEELIDFITKEAATYIVVTLKSNDMMQVVNELKRLQAEVDRLTADKDESRESFIQKTIG